MDDFGLGNANDPVRGFRYPSAKLGFFVIHEKVRVKRPYGIQYLTRNHQVGACDETDFNRMFRMVEQSVSAEAQSG